MTYELYTDGGARGNPGPAAIGVVLKKDGKVIYEHSSYIGKDTNNVAEYKAILSGLETSAEKGIKEVDCYLDSELVVKQLNGEYKVKQPHLRLLWTEVKTVENKFVKISYHHVKREKNKHADMLVNKVLDEM